MSSNQPTHPQLIKSIFFLLHRTSHPGNVGGSARAMNSMGFNNLELINPENFPNPKATAMATHAKEILEKAKVYQSLEQALSNKNVVFALSARKRDLNWPHLDANEAAKKIWQYAEKGNKVAILFGPEDSGLSNQELSKSNYLVHILSDPKSNSLNLSQAVQIIAYELFVKKIKKQKILEQFRMDEPLAKGAEIEHLLAHLNQVLDKTGFLINKQNQQLKIRLERIFRKAQLDHQEAALFRGILSSMLRYQNEKDKGATN